MPVSEALRIARLQARTELTSQVIALACDPLWSTVLGFLAVHKLRKEDLIGPVADDILYAGIIAINTARQPGLMELAGKTLSSLGAVAAGTAGGVGVTAAGAKAAKAWKGVKTVKSTQSVAELGQELAAGKSVRLMGFGPGGVQKMTPAQLDHWAKKPAWKRFLGIG